MKQRILIVDDEVTFATILSEYFAEQGYNVRTVHDGVAALEEARCFNPAVILTDIQMPRRNGYEWSQEMRKHSGNPILIFMSAYDRYHDPEIIEKCRADLYLQKPFKLAELDDFIEKRLASRGPGGANVLKVALITIMSGLLP